MVSKQKEFSNVNTSLSRENCSVLMGPGAYRSGISAHSMKGEATLSSRENLPWYTENEVFQKHGGCTPVTETLIHPPIHPLS